MAVQGAEMDRGRTPMDALFRDHAPWLRGTATRLLGSRADAEEVVQEAFLRLQGQPDLPEGAAPSWLRTTVVRLALMRLRSSRRRRDRHPISEHDYVQAPAPSPDLIDTLALDRAIAALPDRLRVVFVMHHVEGFTHAEIARELGISIAASAKRLSRAVERLRKRLGEHG